MFTYIGFLRDTYVLSLRVNTCRKFILICKYIYIINNWRVYLIVGVIVTDYFDVPKKYVIKAFTSVIDKRKCISI